MQTSAATPRRLASGMNVTPPRDNDAAAAGGAPTDGTAAAPSREQPQPDHALTTAVASLFHIRRRACGRPSAGRSTGRERRVAGRRPPPSPAAVDRGAVIALLAIARRRV